MASGAQVGEKGFGSNEALHEEGEQCGAGGTQSERQERRTLLQFRES